MQKEVSRKERQIQDLSRFLSRVEIPHTIKDNAIVIPSRLIKVMYNEDLIYVFRIEVQLENGDSIKILYDFEFHVTIFGSYYCNTFRIDQVKNVKYESGKLYIQF